MRNVTLERTLAAPRSAVWEVLADYPNIAEWNEGVLASHAIGDATEGVGARRQCELGPSGSIRMRETVAEWAPEDRMVIDIDNIEKMPVNEASMTFTLSDEGEATAFTMSYDYKPKGGPLALILGPILDRQMPKGFNGFIDSLEAAARAQAA